ncbi:MAG: 6-phosphogluconolactonase [Candidatus Nomurabacteria bacterium]|nr:6-phosphogluconolactonase [Candidatus Nomurabacteria bacterium]
MSFVIKTTTKAEDPVNFIASSILNQLKSGKTVLFFVTGGSSIAVAVRVSVLLKDHDLVNLTIMMTDERYGEPNHVDSNWHQMFEKGFNLSRAKLIPILTGDDFETTVEKFNEDLAYEFNVAQYTIGLFGVGKDGHTAGILPLSVAVESKDLACGYTTPEFSRITITPELIKNLDEAVVFMQGEEKWSMVRDLVEKKIDIKKQPAQILKKVPLLTLFSDY